MTMRFNTWIEADSLEEAWEKLRLSLTDKNMGDKLKERFTATQLEDGEQDKERMTPLTVREVKAFCEKHVTYDPRNWHGGCPLLHEACNGHDCDCYRVIPANWNVEEIEEKIRGEKE